MKWWLPELWILVIAIVVFASIAKAQTYATFDPTAKGSSVTLSGGNLTTAAGGYTNANTYSNVSQASGKHYFEITYSSGTLIAVGVAASQGHSTYVGGFSGSWTWWGGALAEYNPPQGELYYNGSNSSYGSGPDPGDTIGVAVDVDAGKIWFRKNGTWQGGGDPVAGTSPALSGLTGALYAAVIVTGQATANFGATPFQSFPPGGFASGWCDGGCAVAPRAGEALLIAGMGAELAGVSLAIIAMVCMLVGAACASAFIEGWNA